MNYSMIKSGGSEILTVDPDSYRRTPKIHKNIHNQLQGDRNETILATHYDLQFDYNYMTETELLAWREALALNELLYLDDSDVPYLVESKALYTKHNLNFIDIENTSATHVAYTDSSASEPSAIEDFETTEISTANYQNIDGDDSNYSETTNPTAGFSLYHKFEFEYPLGSFGIQRLRINIAASSSDASDSNEDGIVMYIWNGTNWQEVSKTTNNDKQYLRYSTFDPITADTFVVSGKIRVLLQTRNQRVSTDALNLRTYYVECVLNEGLSSTLTLTNTPVLIDGDITWVKNTTNVDFENFTKGIDYTISGNDVIIGGIIAELNGSTHNFNAGNVLNAGTNDFSFSCWVKRDGIPGGGTSDWLCEKYSGATGLRILLGVSTGDLRAFIRDSSGQTSGLGGDNICDNEWHHIAVTYDRDGNMTRYVDGTLYDSATNINDRTLTISNTSDFRIGSASDGSNSLDGSIFDARFVIGTVWTPTEIATQFTNGRDITVGGAITSSWAFNDDYFNTVIEDTTAGNDLSLVGGTITHYGVHSRAAIVSYDEGDVLEVQYNRKFEGIISHIDDLYLPGNPESARTRQVSTIFSTLSPDVIGNTQAFTPSWTSSLRGAAADGNNTGTRSTDYEDFDESITFYKWTSSEASLQNYYLKILWTLPNDFDSWETTNAIAIEYYTNANNTYLNAHADIYIYQTGSGVEVGSSTNLVSAEVWTTESIDASTLNSAHTWTAGDVIEIFLKFEARNNYDVRFRGDVITFNYVQSS